MMVTISLATIVFITFTIKAQEVKDYDNVNIRTYDEPFFYSHDFALTSDEELHFAFAFSDYTNNPDPIDNADYGEIISRINSWGFGDTVSVTQGAELPLKRCSPAELGLEGSDKSKFFPTHKTSLRDLELYQKRFWCYDFEQMKE